jgi:5-hydroxyisourate hydrolase
MAGISIHVIDVSRGVPAAGMAVEVWNLEAGGQSRISAGAIGAEGHYDDAVLATRELMPGRYEARFEIGSYYRAAGIALPEPAFLESVRFEFGLANSAQHYHLPLKMTPWGYSLFRGGS